MEIAGKTVLVTGGTDGIGRQIALQMQALGATVMITGRNAERIARARAEGMEPFCADLADPAGVNVLLQALGGRPIDILINNAGMGADHDFRVAAPDPVDNARTIQLNLATPIRLITGLMPMLTSRPEAMIVNITSGLALAPSAGTAVYSATKAGLRSYTLSLRAQLRATRIHVLEVLPPMVDTAMTASRSGSKLSADACAAAIITAIRANADEANVGMVRMLKAINQVAPWLTRRIMINF